MASLSRFLYASTPPFLNPSKSLKSSHKSRLFISNCLPICSSTHLSSNPLPCIETRTPNHLSNDNSKSFLLKNLTFLGSYQSLVSVVFLRLSFPLSCFASETTFSSEEFPNKINLESILVSIDNFFNRYPFFVATVVFIWFVVIPLTEEYLQKYKFISAINAFRKLQDEPNCKLLDIRDSKSLAYLGSPNLKILGKSTLQLEFREGDEDGFAKKVLKSLEEPENTTVCVIDNFDGNSMKVAEILVKNGFKEAYAIRGGLRGKKGWLEIQESLLPPSVHVFPKNKAKQRYTNGVTKREDSNNNDISLVTSSSSSTDIRNKEIRSEEGSTVSPTLQSKDGQRPLSPYPNYPDLKPPSSPAPSKPY